MALDQIVPFTQERWAKVDPEKKRYWRALYVGHNSPLLIEQRPNTGDYTRGLTLWRRYRDVLASGAGEASRLLNELHEADRWGSTNPFEVRAILAAYHADAETALSATDLELKLADALGQNEIGPGEIPDWLKRDATLTPSGLALNAAPGNPLDPRGGRLAPGSLQPQTVNGYALVVTGHGSMGEARLLADLLLWSRKQNPLAPIDPDRIRAELDALKPSISTSRAGHAVGIVSSLYYKNTDAIRDFVSQLPKDMPVIVHGTIVSTNQAKPDERVNRLHGFYVDLAKQLDRRVHEAELTPAADNTAPHDLRYVDAFDNRYFFRNNKTGINDYANSIIFLNTRSDRGLGGIQYIVNTKLVDLSQHVVTFDDAHNDWGVHQAHWLALQSGKLAAAFDKTGSARSLDEIAAADRHYMKTQGDKIRERIPTGKIIDSPAGALLLSNMGFTRADIQAVLAHGLDTIGSIVETQKHNDSLTSAQIKSGEFQALPVPPQLRDKIRDPHTWAKAADLTDAQLDQASAQGISALALHAEPMAPLAERLKDSDGRVPAVVWIKGNPEALLSFGLAEAPGTAAIVGTVEDAGEQIPHTADSILDKLASQPSGLATHDGLRVDMIALADGNKYIEFAMPETDRPGHIAALKKIGLEPENTDNFQPVPKDKIDKFLAHLAERENTAPTTGLSNQGKARTALLGAALAGNGITTVTTLDAGVPLFAIHGAAAAGGKILAVAPVALDRLQGDFRRDAVEAIIGNGGAVISAIPPLDERRDTRKSFEMAARLSSATILAEARANDLSLAALAEADARGKPILALAPDSEHVGAHVTGNLTLLEGPGHTHVQTETRAIGVNTTMFGPDKPQIDPEHSNDSVQIINDGTTITIGADTDSGVNDRSITSSGFVTREIRWNTAAAPVTLDEIVKNGARTLSAIAEGKIPPTTLGAWRTAQPAVKTKTPEEKSRFVRTAMADYRRLTQTRYVENER